MDAQHGWLAQDLAAHEEGMWQHLENGVSSTAKLLAPKLSCPSADVMEEAPVVISDAMRWLLVVLQRESEATTTTFDAPCSLRVCDDDSVPVVCRCSHALGYCCCTLGNLSLGLALLPAC